MKKNILIDIRSLLPMNWSGVENFTLNTTNQILKTKKYNTHLFFNCFKNNKKFIEKNFKSLKKNKIYQTRIPNKIFHLSAGFLRFPKIDYLFKKKIDLFFVPDPRPSPISKNCKKISFFHDLSLELRKSDFSQKTKIWKKILRLKKEATESDAIICPSNFIRKQIIEKYKINKKKIFVVKHGITNPNINPTTKKDNFILSMSPANPRKNIKNLILAFNILKKTFPKLRLKIIGEKKSKIFKNPKLPNFDGIDFLEKVHENEKFDLLKKAKAFIFPSFYEGFGLPILEASKMQTNLILSDIPVFHEISKNNAIFFDPHSPKDIAKKINLVLIKNNNKFFLKNIKTWTESAKEITDIFDFILRKH